MSKGFKLTKNDKKFGPEKNFGPNATPTDGLLEHQLFITWSTAGPPRPNSWETATSEACHPGTLSGYRSPGGRGMMAARSNRVRVTPVQSAVATM